MIRVYYHNDRPVDVLSWLGVMGHIGRNDRVEVGYDATIGAYVIIEVKE